MTKSKLEVRPYDPRRRVLAVILVVLGAAGLAWGSWELGRRSAGYDLTALAEDKRALERRVERLRETNRELRRRQTQTKRFREVDGQAAESLRKKIVDLQDRILELREEVRFYRGIVSPSDAQAGVRVQDFSMRPAEDDNHYYYELVLIQALEHNDVISGGVRITAEGRHNGESTTVSLAELDDPDGDALWFSFRYFQSFEGTLAFPKGFSPARVKVELIPSGSGNDRVTRTFQWSSLTG